MAIIDHSFNVIKHAKLEKNKTGNYQSKNANAIGWFVLRVNPSIKFQCVVSFQGIKQKLGV